MRFMKIVLLFCLCVITMPSFAEDATLQRAIDLINQAEALYQGDSAKATMLMKIKTPDFERELRMDSASIGRDDSLIRILSPKKDRGIATLKLGDEMWNYFPKINKVIKVPPSMMMGSWMGSDFTNDDLVKQTTLTEAYNLSMEETSDEFRITLVPKAQTVTVWGRIDYILDRKLLTPIAQNFYDDKGVIIRRMDFKEPKMFSGKLLPSVMEMVPLNKEGHSTTIVYESLEFDSPDISSDDFSLRNLKKRF